MTRNNVSRFWNVWCKGSEGTVYLRPILNGYLYDGSLPPPRPLSSSMLYRGGKRDETSRRRVLDIEEGLTVRDGPSVVNKVRVTCSRWNKGHWVSKCDRRTKRLDPNVYPNRYGVNRKSRRIGKQGLRVVI